MMRAFSLSNLCLSLLRNSAVDTVDQELLFVGTENGKLLAMRDLIKKVVDFSSGGQEPDSLIRNFWGLLWHDHC